MSWPQPLQKIVSGGQTGADMAALDAALEHGVPHGGWCPRGRRSLDGPIPARYELIETPSSGYLQRTGWNVRDSDGTVVFTLTDKAAGGSLATLDFCRRHGKPALHLTPAELAPEAALRDFITRHGIRTLNVAGSREQKQPGIHAWVKALLERALFTDRELT